MSESPGNPPAPCPRCASPLRADGLCLRCAGVLAFSADLAPPPEMPASLGTLRYFGDYELVEEIARGGMGVVYRALQLSLNREVAVKLMLHGALASAEDVERFHVEAKAAAGLKHPGIISIHEVGESEGQHYFSMDLVRGRNVDELTRQGPLPSRAAAELLVQVGDAVDYAHRQGVLHRDLKPSNVIVDTENRPHVTDFGLARRIHFDATLTQPGQVLGTPGFMAPELAAGAGHAAGVGADVYSLGALLYHVLTSRAPFSGPSLADVLRQVAEKEPVSPRLLNPSVPRDLETICLKCLAKDPAARYATAAALAEDLGRFLRDEPIVARPIGTLGRLWRWSRRNPALATLGASVFLLLAVVAAGSTVAATRLERARRQEATLRAESEARLRQGEKLIEFMLGDLSDRLEPVGRLDVLDTTITEIDKFYSEVPPEKMTPESKRNRARSFMQVANIRITQGRFPEAYENFERSMGAYKALIAAYPENLTWQFEMTRVLNDIGIAHLRQSEPEKGAAVLEECLKLRQELLVKQPDNTYWLSSAGATAQNLSHAYRALGNLPRTGELLRIAEAAQRQWMKAEPTSSKPKQRLAIVLGTLGAYLAADGRVSEGMKAYEEKIQIFKDLVKSDPKDSTYRFDLALGLGQISEFHIELGHYAEAQASLESSLSLFEQLMKEDPGNSSWKIVMDNTLLNLGMAYRWQGKFQEAIETFERQWKISHEDPAVLTTYPKWALDCRNGALNAAEVLREKAKTARSAGREDEAKSHESAAAVWDERLKSLPQIEGTPTG